MAAFPPVPPVEPAGLGSASSLLSEGLTGGQITGIAQGFVHHVRELKSGRLEDGMSVREKISARCGRLHWLRAGERIVRKLDPDKRVWMPSSEDSEWLREHEKRLKTEKEVRRRRSHRKRRGRSRRQRDSSSGSTTTTLESDSAQPFRAASSAGTGDSRAARDAERNAHHVLVESLWETARTLPRAAGEAAYQKADVYRRLSPVYSAHFRNILQPALDGHGASERRNSRELETLSEALDLLLDGEALKCIMVLLGRRKAVIHASVGGGTWTSAPYLEMLPPPGSALSARDRGNASRDLKDAMKLAKDEGKHALPPRAASRPGGGSRAGGSERRGGADRRSNS